MHMNRARRVVVANQPTTLIVRGDLRIGIGIGKTLQRVLGDVLSPFTDGRRAQQLIVLRQ
ncbi:hypothetical protein D9M71_789870 [compost metagenome]